MKHRALKKDAEVHYLMKFAPSSADEALGKSPAARPISHHNPICSVQKSLEPTAKTQHFYNLFWIKVTSELNTQAEKEFGACNVLQ